MTLDIARLRAETPGTLEVAHFNNAGSSLMTAPVLQAVTDHLTLESRIGGYEAAGLAKAAIDRFYAAAARAVAGKPHEIAFVENATRAWDMAFYAFDWKPGDRVLTARSEYNSNMIAYRQVARRFGVDILLIDNDESGAIDTRALENAVDERTRLIALTHIPTNDGLINPAAAVGRIARAAGVPYLLDACQSVGHLPIDVAEIGCTMLSTTGRKYIRGPRGTGFLWVREDWVERLEPPFLDNRAASWTAVEDYRIQPDARRFENWEFNVAGKIGLAVALDRMADIGMPAIWARIRALATRLRDGLAAIDGVSLHDTGREKSGLVTFTKAGESAVETRARLATAGINVSASKSQLTRHDLLDAGIDVMVRASVHAYNTEEEVDRLLAVVADG
ncbi:aminotransferase class V-fold PLP-dependent enzyme [Marivibrio halodurans]|uniref:Aminotransferase class V-fold PLP-dependent enzyme n=1 Tax=Marivibrio halodurans TaxID=2039722 RepID=A0A8J7S183_9PROT|nr:aminotransferase class V-fold PLP-dependent enzyme [Marivibrio halodurans]MBP5856829.1 aminotransferase class V-fold PLP-dependent enzyme [Marivibrio halodurans]